MNQENRDCCQGIAFQTPQTVDNRPGLSAIAYRVGEHGHFKASMLAGLSRALPALKTRDDDDFTIALLDAWATLADVLTFYQERIANESYLRTAAERRSLLELAQLIGYELRPGVAASTYLAFTLEDRAGEITVKAGTQVQSMPGENELPQRFETAIDITARPEWNKIKVRQTRRHPYVDAGGELLETFYLEGLDAGLSPGDYWLVDKGTGDPPLLRVVAEVTPEAALKRTRVDVQQPPPPSTIFAVLVWAIQALQIQAKVQPSVTTQKYLGKTIKAPLLKAQAITQQFQVANILKNLKAAQKPPPRILTFRTKAAIFAHNAPQRSALPANLREGEVVPTSTTTTKFVAGPFNTDSKWVEAKSVANYPNSSAGAGKHYLFLDSTYDKIVAGSTVVLQDRGYWQHYKVLEVATMSISEFTLSGKVTRLTIELPPAGAASVSLSTFKVRTTAIYAQSDTLPLARLPIETPVQDDEIELEGWIDGLAAEQNIIVEGEDADDRGNTVRERAVLKEVAQVVALEGHTRLTLKTALKYRYVRDTVAINANVAPATHGETKTEVLGSGRGEEAFARYRLRNTPLTYVSSATSASGAASTLQVRIDGLRWHEVSDFRDSKPTDRHYLVRHDDNGNTTVVTGDGRQGARAPTGTENVQATYRVGIGRPGNVAADKISLLARRPLGVQRVTNPLAASGGADTEKLEDARQNAALTVLTLERIVSLQDYEDFARAFAGISKALATWTWMGEERGVYLTVAGVDGLSIGKNDDLYGKLLRAIRAAGDPSVPLRLAADPSYRPIYFFVEGTLTVQADYVAADVVSAVAKALKDHFAYARRQFGQDVTLSEVVAMIHSVKGVIAADIDALYRTDTDAGPEAEPKPHPRLVARLPQSGSRANIEPAELLLLDPRPLSFGVKQDG